MLSYFLIFIILTFSTIKSQQKDFKLKLSEDGLIQYLLYLPNMYNKNSEEKFPLLIFLHGGGESGEDIEKVKTHGPPKLIEEGKDFPFLVLSPQNRYEKKFWNGQTVISLLDTIVKSYRVDEDRIYLTGMSRGGYGAWSIAMQYPKRFAALVPICGASPLPYARWIKDIPIWVFHGELDDTIPVEESIGITDYLIELGADVQLTTYPNIGHNSWDTTYSNPELYQWMLSKSKKNKLNK